VRLTQDRTGVQDARRVAVVLSAGYGSFGYFWGTWVVTFPEFLATHRLTPGGASPALVALSVTSIAVMLLLAPRLEPLPRRISVALALAVNGAGAILIAAAPTSMLIYVFALTGIGTGLVDVFVSAAGQESEARLNRPVLQRVHASYSAGGAAGALITAALLSGGASWAAALVLSAAVQFAAALLSRRSDSLVAAPPRSEARPALSLTVFVRAPLLAFPTLVLLSSFFIEGSMDVWSVIYLRRTLDASTLTGAASFAAFALAMAAGRTFAARILFGLGYRQTILFSGLGSMIAGVVIVTTTEPAVAGAAFLVLGFTVAAAAPAAFGLAGGFGLDSGVVVAAMTSVGYAGFVIGPPLLGRLADEVGLRATMAAVVAATVGIAAGAIPKRIASREPEEPL
jgi:MFS family permease